MEEVNRESDGRKDGHSLDGEDGIAVTLRCVSSNKQDGSGDILSGVSVSLVLRLFVAQDSSQAASGGHVVNAVFATAESTGENVEGGKVEKLTVSGFGWYRCSASSGWPGRSWAANCSV